jgi:predicted AlkP superfamily phosphohydrolase/phosphomutase
MILKYSFRLTALTYCLLILSFLVVGCGGGKSPQHTPKDSKLILLGFDGADPTWLNRWMDEGLLPNLAKLRTEGDFHTLGSTIPPQSPVAWATFATGTNPGGHGIFDFLNRSPESYMPNVANMKLTPPKFLLNTFLTAGAHAEVTRGGTAFWKVAADSGVKSTLLSIPYAFPPENISPGHMLCGLGVPDLRETNSTFTYLASDLTQEELAQPIGGGKLTKVEAKFGEIATNLEAMVHPTKKERVLIPINFSIRDERSVEVRLGDKSIILKIGSWSPWLPFEFNLTPLVKVSGICKLYLFTSSPEFRLFVTPLSMDPCDPYMPISFPEQYAKELYEKVGYFKTVGWLYDTSSLNEERATDDMFVEDMNACTAEQEKIFVAELEKRDWDLFVGVFTDTDRAAHMFWRYLDPLHPLYTAEGAAKYGDVIQSTYRHMDQFVGMVMDKYVDANTTLIVMSDHGFHSFRRCFNTNTWLAQNGYLTFKGMEKLPAGSPIPAELYPKGEFFPNINWSKTKAYALGTGQIYVNLMGRESQGIVKPGQEYHALLNEMSSGLLQMRDPLNDSLVFRKIYQGDEVYRGVYNGQAPDLALGFADGYRTSKETMLGGIPAELLYNNLNKWSGDHSASAMEETSGIIFSNRKILSDDPRIIDIAPTVLKHFNINLLPEMEGESIFSNSAQKIAR